jgi:hypothetical protein
MNMSESKEPFWKRKEFVVGLLFVIVVPVVAQLMFSKYGFNPTDDGFVLAGSRRILDGEIPHKDFIWIRPTGSLYLHAPFVALGGDHTLLLSRFFVWFELAVTAWMWTLIISRKFNVFSSPLHKGALALASFVFSAHVFPPMAWHSIDAMTFASIGLVLCIGREDRTRLIGYIVLGSSILFRQNFVVMPLAALFLLGDWRRLRYWIAVAVPGALFLVYLGANGALSDFLSQMTASSGEDPFWTGFGKYVRDAGTWIGLIVGFLATLVFQGRPSIFRTAEASIWLRSIAIASLLLIPIVAFGIMLVHGTDYIHGSSFALFGAALGVALSYLAVERKLKPMTACSLLAVAGAWAVSVSAGYNTPALGTGPLVLVLICSVELHFTITKNGRWPRPGELKLSENSTELDRVSISRYVASIFVIWILVCPVVWFADVRYAHIYLEPSSRHLIYDLGDVLAGGEGVKVDRDTYAVLGDLKNITDNLESQGKEFAIVPDMAAFWVKSEQKNALPCDWPQNVELGSSELVQRVENVLHDRMGNIVVIVEKYEASKLGTGMVPLSGSYKIVQYVEENFSVTSTTDYFLLYE